MRNKSCFLSPLAPYLYVLLFFCLTPAAMAECVDSFTNSLPPEFQLATIAAIDANNGCNDITGQVGCSIKNPAVGNSCDYSDTEGNQFTATITGFDALGMRWQISNNNVEIDTAIYGGGSGGKNNCAAFHTYDVSSGSGGDCKTFNADGSCATYQNFTSLDVCTDLVQENAPAPSPMAETLPNCDTLPGGKLDNTGITCPTDGMGNLTTEPVVVCNLQKDQPDWGTSDGSAVCCQCNITQQQTACIVSPDNPECTQTMTVDPTQSVELMFFRNDEDPCYWPRGSSGWTQICW